MTERVKRTYNSPRRRQQAAETRAEILAAAQRLFARHGYAATSVAAIAQEAGVATKTVYLAFESKSGVLRGLWNAQLRGQRDDTTLPPSRWYEDALDEPDPEQRLRMAAHFSRTVKARAGVVLDAIRIAAPSDPDLAALWERIETGFRDVLQSVVESVAADGALRPGLDVDEATDILWLLVHPDTWRLLVDVRGWTPERYEQWCADTACEQLLRS
jgi:AcrR family transcriptional regulator